MNPKRKEMSGEEKGALKTERQTRGEEPKEEKELITRTQEKG